MCKLEEAVAELRSHATSPGRRVSEEALRQTFKEIGKQHLSVDEFLVIYPPLAPRTPRRSRTGSKELFRRASREALRKATGDQEPLAKVR